MYLYWWIIAIIVFFLVCLIIRAERLSHRVKDLRKTIAKLEGREGVSEKDIHCETTGDCEGMG